jgi:hypothetical protein
MQNKVTSIPSGTVCRRLHSLMAVMHMKKHFCSSHLSEHRVKLAKQMNEINRGTLLLSRINI